MNSAGLRCSAAVSRRRIASPDCGVEPGNGGSVTVQGAGSSFQKAFDEAVIAAFQNANSKITVTYNPIGSGSGKTALQTKDVHFAGTDSLPKPADLGKYQGGALLYFPTVAAPISSGVDPHPFVSFTRTLSPPMLV